MSVFSKKDRVFMLKPDRDRHNKIIIGTVGEVVGVRGAGENMEWLVKFKGHTWPRTCKIGEIIK